MSIIPEVNLYWLITGNGEMLRTEPEGTATSGNPETEARLWNLVESQQKTIERQSQTIEGQQRTIEVMAKKGGAEGAGGAAVRVAQG
ncbi:MAG: hypothetical protein LUD76_10030 [Alistipes sp.]|nr:hypothetical protein [Alistipes sp.]